MKTFMLSDVECPQVVFEVGGHEIESTVIKNAKKIPNFDRPLLFLDVVCARCSSDRDAYWDASSLVRRCYPKRISMRHQ